MGRQETGRRAAVAARDASRPYASKADYVPSPTSAHFPPMPSSDSPPHFSQSTPGSKLPSIPASASEELPDGTYALEPDEFGSYQGFPSVQEYQEIENTYLRGLSSRKQEKALITQAMYDSIHAVLMDPTNTTYGTPQFRFWVRKMFVLACFQGEYTVTHEEKPVAAKEQIYQILVHCHGECYHGGRDKTCSQIKQYYSWIPKELVAQFVKACPTCVLKRSNNPKKFVAMLKDIGADGHVSEHEYLDYFTSPARAVPIIPGSVHSSGSKSRPVPMPLILDERYHQQQQQHNHVPVYTPGALDDPNALLRRDSSSTGSSVSSHTPLSATFPHSAGSDQSWGLQQQQHDAFGQHDFSSSHMQQTRSSEDIRATSAWEQSARHHQFSQQLMAPPMAPSFSESAAQGRPTYGGNTLTVPQGFANHLHPSLASGFMDGYRQQQQAQQNGVHLPPILHHPRPNVAVKLEDSVQGYANNFNSRNGLPTQSPERNSPPTPSRLPQTLSQRRLGAPAPLSLGGSNFAAYRGAPAIHSAATVAGDFPSSVPGSATDPFFIGISHNDDGFPRSAPAFGGQMLRTHSEIGVAPPLSATSATFGNQLNDLTINYEDAGVHGLDMLSAASMSYPPPSHPHHHHQGHDEAPPAVANSSRPSPSAMSAPAIEIVDEDDAYGDAEAELAHLAGVSEARNSNSPHDDDGPEDEDNDLLSQ